MRAVGNNKKVIVRLRGGLGNQISCFYAGLYLAKLNKADLTLDGRFIKFGGNPEREMEVNKLDFAVPNIHIEFRSTIQLPKSRLGRKITRPALVPISKFLDHFEKLPILGDNDSLIGLKIESNVLLDGYFPSYE